MNLRTLGTLRASPIFLCAWALACAATPAQAQGWWYRTRITQRYGQNSYAPAFKSTPYPEYPFELVRAAVTGKAAVKFKVLADGRVANVELMSASNEKFGDAAMKAVRSWVFLPLKVNGPNYPSEVTVESSFVFEFAPDD